MPEDNEHGGGSPPEAPPPEVEGAARFAGFRVDKKGNFWSGNECIEKAPEEPFHPKDEGLQTKIRVGDEELSVEEIAALKRDADEVRRLKEEIEPYSAILKDQRMHDLIRQGQEEGYWQGPTIPVAEPEDMGRYKALQNSDPMFNDTREAMQTYAANLTIEQQQALDSNPSCFLQIYEKVRKTVGDKPSPRRATPLDEVVRSIRAKERAKDLAVLPRSIGSDPTSSEAAHDRKQYQSDLRSLRTGDNDTIADVLARRIFGGG